MKTALVLLSGGMDSAAALWWARERYRVVTLSFLVPGAAAGERRAARALSRAAGAAAHHEVQLGFLVNHRPGHPAGYLPKRNLVYYAIAGSIAEQAGAVALVGGHLATDGGDFPDARPAYFARIRRMLGLPLKLPFLDKTKRDVVKYGLSKGVPFGLSWSCFRDGTKPCGRCASCREREEAFEVKS